jgi:ribose transport system ATP-binding protein
VSRPPGCFAGFKSALAGSNVSENGAGKSTMLGVIAGSVQPDSGTVSLGGQLLPGGTIADVSATSTKPGEVRAREHAAVRTDIFVRAAA